LILPRVEALDSTSSQASMSFTLLGQHIAQRSYSLECPTKKEKYLFKSLFSRDLSEIVDNTDLISILTRLSKDIRLICHMMIGGLGWASLHPRTPYNNERNRYS